MTAITTAELVGRPRTAGEGMASAGSQPWVRTIGTPTPEELALRAQRGSLAAYSELVDRFEVRLFNFLLRRVGSAADAETPASIRADGGGDGGDGHDSPACSVTGSPMRGVTRTTPSVTSTRVVR